MNQNNVNISCINNNVKEIKFNLNETAQVCKVLIQSGTQLSKNDVIFIMIDSKGQRQSFLSSISGIVTKLYIHELDILSYDSLILEYNQCRHKMVFKNLCADCGIDLNQVNNVLSTSKFLKKASIYHNEENDDLLVKRKLYLMINIDQTLIHTTNSKNHLTPSSDIIAYQLTPISPIFYTKLRPGIKEFLTNLYPFYRFHAFTNGDQLYADNIIRLIDPNKRFFSQPILSYNQSLNFIDKTTNLNSLFPFNDALMCIIDSTSEDIWENTQNLIHIKPYIYFRNVGNINNISQTSLTEITEQKYQRENDQWNKKLNKYNDGYNQSDNNSQVIMDTDVYLRQLEIILKHIHTKFYIAYDQWVEQKHEIMPDLKQIIPNIRREILTSVSLCFSHLMPQDYPLEKYRGTIMATSMGAKVTQDLQFDQNGNIQTTHVIAGKRTLKAYQAQQYKINVVTPEWLTDCYQLWEKRPEDSYILTSKYRVRKSSLYTPETPQVYKRPHCDMLQQLSLDQLSFSHEQMTSQQNDSQINNTTSSNTLKLEDLFDQYNFSLVMNQSFDIDKKVNDLSIEDNDNSNEIYAQPFKQQRTIKTENIIPEKTNDNDNEDLDLNSSNILKIHYLTLENKDHCNSDEDN